MAGRAQWQSDNPFERIWGTQNIPKDSYVRSMSNTARNFPNLNYQSGGSSSSAFKNLSNMMPGSGISVDEYERQRQLALAKRAQQSQPSFSDQMNQGTVSLTPQQFAGYTNSLIETNQGDGTNWWDGAADLISSSGPLGGLKGWVDIGSKALGAYAGLQQVGAAKDQNRLARDAFTFQKAAWNKDYDARKIAYNTNAQMRNDWKAAQTPGGYTMDALIA